MAQFPVTFIEFNCFIVVQNFCDVSALCIKRLILDDYIVSEIERASVFEIADVESPACRCFQGHEGAGYDRPFGLFADVNVRVWVDVGVVHEEGE
jgi:hypothetical protein